MSGETEVLTIDSDDFDIAWKIAEKKIALLFGGETRTVSVGDSRETMHTAMADAMVSGFLAMGSQTIIFGMMPPEERQRGIDLIATCAQEGADSSDMRLNGMDPKE